MSQYVNITNAKPFSMLRAMNDKSRRGKKMHVLLVALFFKYKYQASPCAAHFFEILRFVSAPPLILHIRRTTTGHQSPSLIALSDTDTEF